MTYKEYLNCKRDYQDDGSTFLLERKHACLFYKPGKGKTYPCIDAIRCIDESLNGRANVLILSTADAIKNMWQVEIEPQNIMPENTLYMTFNSAIMDDKKSKLLKIKWDVVVVDESHKIKSHNSKTSKLCYLLTKKCKYVFGLSGTPRGNVDLDIFCQFHNLNVSEYGTISYANFVDNCCDIEQKYFGARMVQVPIGISKKYKDGWNNQVAMYSQMVGYSDEDNMPELNEIVVKIDYEPTKEYKNCEEGIISMTNYENTLNKLSAIQKAHQAANGFLYIPMGDKIDTVRFQHNKKLDWLKSNIINEPTVIVYRHIADKEDLISIFPYAIESIDDFKSGKSNLLLLQCSRCESFNLQMCRKIIFYTMDYSFIKYNQMIHRVWRMGQDKNVTIIILIQNGTIEEVIWSAVKNKSTASNLLFSKMKEYANGQNARNAK